MEVMPSWWEAYTYGWFSLCLSLKDFALCLPLCVWNTDTELFNSLEAVCSIAVLYVRSIDSSRSMKPSRGWYIDPWFLQSLKMIMLSTVDSLCWIISACCCMMCRIQPLLVHGHCCLAVAVQLLPEELCHDVVQQPVHTLVSSIVSPSAMEERLYMMLWGSRLARKLCQNFL